MLVVMPLNGEASRWDGRKCEKRDVSLGPILEEARMPAITLKSRTAKNPSRNREDSARIIGR